MRAVAAQSVTSQWQQHKSRRLPPAHFLGKRWTHGLFRFMRKTCWARCTAAACCLAPSCTTALLSFFVFSSCLCPCPWPPAPPPAPAPPPPALPCPAPVLLPVPLLPLLAQTPFPGPFLPQPYFLSSPALDFLEDEGPLLLAQPPCRLRHRVGHQVLLPGFTGRSLEDDVSWKGSGTTRVATIQCASSDRGSCLLWCGFRNPLRNRPPHRVPPHPRV